MDEFFKNGIRIASGEFENFLLKLKSYKITNIYINKFDLGQISITKNESIIHIGNGLILELNKSKCYKLCGGFGIGDYFLKIIDYEKIIDKNKYQSVIDLKIENLKNLIDKQASWIISKTFHGQETVLRSLEIRFSDQKDKVQLVGSNFKSVFKNQTIEYYDGAWIILDDEIIDNLEIL